MSKSALILRIICAIVLVYFVLFSIKWVPRITHGFATYYTFSRMLIEGDDLSKAYDDNYFNLKVEEYGINVSDILASNIPLNSIALLPFAWLSPQAARVLWSLFSIAAFLFSVYILLKAYALSLRSEIGMVVFIIIFLWRPVYENIAFGQFYFILLLLFSLSLYGLSKRKSFLLSFPISLAFLLKSYGIVNFIWLLVKKLKKELALTLTAVLIGIIAGILILGTTVWSVYISDASRKLGQMPYMGHVAYQTVNSFIMHLFVYDEKWLPHPLLSLPQNVVFLAALVINIIVIVFIVFDKAEMPEHLLLSFSAAIAAGVVTAPVAEEYHYVLFLPLAVGLCKYLFEKFKEKPGLRLQNVLYLASLLIMIVPLNYKNLQFSRAPVYILAYPKLFAGMLLLAVYRFGVKSPNAI